jgi:hypothetical protein
VLENAMICLWRYEICCTYIFGNNLNILNLFYIKYADNIYTSAESPKAGNEGSDDDMESSIAKEIAQMKQPHKSRRFASIQTGADCGIL